MNTEKLSARAAPASAMKGHLRVVLVSTYELGRQPFGLASPAAWLRAAGADVTCLDLAHQALDERTVAEAALVAFYLPMHTATRLATQLLPRVRRVNPDAHLCAYGLYAPMNDDYLRELGVSTIIGGEFEQPLLDLTESLRGGRGLVRGQSVVSLSRQLFRVPDRSELPPLDQYACVRLPDGSHRVAGYTEATRGCKHLCRHCPIVPVYRGHFRVVQQSVVLDDVRQQVEAGARHITFGDPDFLNGPTHAMRLVESMNQSFPELTYDVTIKVEHLRRHADLLPKLRATGCLLVTSAVESFDDQIVRILDKRHTYRDVAEVVNHLRSIGLALNTTFVAFTPWTTLDLYVHFLEVIAELGLVGSVSPVQYAIRLLIPNGSRLLELPETHVHLRGFDREALCHRWRHPDRRMDALQDEIQQLAGRQAWEAKRSDIFQQVCELTAAKADAPQRLRLQRLARYHASAPIPYLSEPWYC
jgi:radical SAM superfamily enzyme YgiQ (UPF0313 family)